MSLSFCDSVLLYPFVLIWIFFVFFLKICDWRKLRYSDSVVCRTTTRSSGKKKEEEEEEESCLRTFSCIFYLISNWIYSWRHYQNQTLNAGVSAVTTLCWSHNGHRIAAGYRNFSFSHWFCILCHFCLILCLYMTFPILSIIEYQIIFLFVKMSRWNDTIVGIQFDFGLLDLLSHLYVRHTHTHTHTFTFTFTHWLEVNMPLITIVFLVAVRSQGKKPSRVTMLIWSTDDKYLITAYYNSEIRVSHLQIFNLFYI
jgi:hypothetical protein